MFYIFLGFLDIFLLKRVRLYFILLYSNVWEDSLRGIQMEKLKKYVQKVCGLFELIMAVIVLLGIVIAIISMVKDVDLTQSLFRDTANFKEFLVNVFAIVIGIEFLEMLCRPNPDNVIQVLVFLIARHMIVGETSPYEDFVSVISVAILLLLSRYLHMGKKGEREDGEREA